MSVASELCPYCNHRSLEWGMDEKMGSSGHFCKVCDYTQSDTESVRDAIDRHSRDRVERARELVAEAEAAVVRRPRTPEEDLAYRILRIAPIPSPSAQKIAETLIAEGWKKSV